MLPAMTQPNRRRLARALRLSAICAPMLVAAVVSAQSGGEVDPTDLAPPEPGQINNSFPVALSYFVMLVLGAAALTATLLPSKRGHQD